MKKTTYWYIFLSAGYRFLSTVYSFLFLLFFKSLGKKALLNVVMLFTINLNPKL